MSKSYNRFLNKVSQVNIMSDGMLKKVTEADLAWLMVLKDKSHEPLKFYEPEENNELK